MAMIAYNLSNVDRPHADSYVAKAAVEISKDVLKSFRASNLLSCRVYAVFGTLLLPQGLIVSSSGVRKFRRLESYSRSFASCYEVWRGVCERTGLRPLRLCSLNCLFCL